MRSFQDAKAMARSLRDALAEREIHLQHSEALEVVARQFGMASWNVLSAQIEQQSSAELPPDANTVCFAQAMPILRIFDVGKAQEFYLDYLGFRPVWEHRFSEDAPLYMEVSRDGLRLHLSEHVGDASPGANMVVYTTGLQTFHAELTKKSYTYLNPGLTAEDWGQEMKVTDPFSNRIRFIERKVS